MRRRGRDSGSLQRVFRIRDVGKEALSKPVTALKHLERWRGFVLLMKFVAGVVRRTLCRVPECLTLALAQRAGKTATMRDAIDAG